MKPTVYILEDEDIVREALCCKADWDRRGFSVVGSSNLGSRAISDVLQLRPDAMMVDIRLPDMTGVDVMRSLRDAYCETEFIILSAYGEFEYAREAIRLGVFDYLTKPMNENKLDEIFGRLFQSLTQNAMRWDDTKLKPEKRAMLSRLLMESEGDSERIVQQLLRIGCNVPGKYNWISTVSAAADEGACLAEIEGMFRLHPRYIDEQQLHILFSRETLLEYSDVLRELQRLKAFPVTAGISRCSREITEFPDMLAQSRIAINAYQDIHQGVIPFEKIAEDLFNDLPKQCVHLIMKEIADSVSLCSEEQVIQKLRQLFGIFKRERIIHPQWIVGMLVDLHYFVIAHLNSQGLTVECKHNNNELTKRYAACMTPNDLEQLVAQDLTGYARLTRQEVAQNMNATVQKAYQYIREHAGAELTVKDVAEALYMNMSYLSHLFKKTTGKNMGAFINEVIIEKARDLLTNTPQNIRQISYSLGYTEHRYFSTMFRRIVGKTPLEYRKSFLLGEKGMDAQ